MKDKKSKLKFMLDEYIITLNEINEIIVRRENLPNPVRIYPALPNFRCKICQSPYISTEKCKNHQALFISDCNLCPNTIYTIGYYKYDYKNKIAGNQLTNDIFIAKSDANSEIIKFFSKIIYRIIVKNNLSPSHLSFIPSRKEINTLTFKLVENVSTLLNIEFINPKQLIKINYTEAIRNYSNYEMRRENIKNTFIIKNDKKEIFGVSKIVLIDDIMHFGLTLNHFCEILKKKSNVKEINAIVLARSVPYKVKKRKIF